MNDIITALSMELRLEILLRLGLSLLAGLALGINFERQNRIAGLRATLITTMIPCVAVIISNSFYPQNLDPAGNPFTWLLAPSILAIGAVTGIGFLGAGMIIYRGKSFMHDATTAITLWFTIIVGLSFGSGLIGFGIITTFISLALLLLGAHLEKVIRSRGLTTSSSQSDTPSDSHNGLLSETHSLADSIPCIDLDKMPEDRAENKALYRLKDQQDDMTETKKDVVFHQFMPSDLKKNHAGKRTKTRRVVAYMF